MFRGIVAVADKNFWRNCGERVWHNGILTLFVSIFGKEIASGRFALRLRYGLRRKEEVLIASYGPTEARALIRT
jgi:hypothetical protein